MSDPPTSSATRVALRIVDGPGPAYLAAAAEAVLQVAGVEVVLVLAVRRVHVRSSAHLRILDRIDSAYAWLERRVLRGGPAALESRRVHLPEGVLVERDDSPAAQMRALQAADVDVLIDLAHEDDPVPLPVPPAGRWHLRYAVGVGGARRPRLSRPTASADLAESLLWIELGTGPGFETGAGVSALRRVGFLRDRDAVHWRSSLLPARRLARLVAGEAVPSAGIDASAVPRSQDRSPAREPWAAPPFGRLTVTVVAKVVERLFFRTGWVVFVHRREPDQGPPRDLTGFEPIEPPRGRFYADPFITETDTGARLYVEDCPDGLHRGRISILRLASDGRWAFERVALDDLEHRAYPHVLRTEAGLLVTPDSGRSGGVDLFIDRGEAVGLERIGHCLDEIPASDPTLLWHDSRFWLFVTVTGHGMSPWDELHLYSAASITGTWHPHPRNPVVADVRRARPAGRIVHRGDDLVRPGQDCSEAYGRRIVLSAITKLTTDEYEEDPIGTIEPEGQPGIQRTHTYTVDGPTETLDGYRKVPRWRRLLAIAGLAAVVGVVGLGQVGTSPGLEVGRPTTSPPGAPSAAPSLPAAYAAVFAGDATGSTDVTEDLTIFLESHDGQRVALAVNGVYKVTQLSFTASDLTVDFRGARIQGSLRGARGIFRVQTSTNIVLNDPTVYGTGYAWSPDDQNEHGIQVDGGSNITINHPTTRNTRGDGIYTGYRRGRNAPPVGVVINDPDIERASRNGISPVAGQVTIRNGHIAYTGLFGIDFEVNDEVGAASIRGVVDGVDIRHHGDLVIEGQSESYAVAAGGYSDATKPSMLIQNVSGDDLRMTIRNTASVTVRNNVSDTSTSADFPGCGTVTFTGNVGIDQR